MADPLRHRQTKGAATDMVDLTPPRHIPTLPITAVLGKSQRVETGWGNLATNKRRPYALGSPHLLHIGTCLLLIGAKDFTTIAI